MMSSPVPNPDTPFTSATPFVLCEAPPPDDLNPRFDESLMQHAVNKGPAACIWQGPQGLVVPRTYTRSATFDDTCAAFANRGWPVSIRHSGGGVVPQGPGILNISLARAMDGRPLDHADTAYRYLCDLIANTLLPFGIRSHAQAVDGSFCDGRFNLAYGTGTEARKIAGTAQLWRRQPVTQGGYVQVVLVHALLLVTTDISMVTRYANELELALGHPRRYLPERAVSLHELTSLPIISPSAFVQDVCMALQAAIQASPD